MLKQNTTLPGLVMEAAEQAIRLAAVTPEASSQNSGAYPAGSVDGVPVTGVQDPGQEALDAHLDDVANPHQVTAAQAGAVGNEGGAPSILEGATAERPAAGTVGRIYLDTTLGLFYRDTGAIWQSVGNNIIPGDTGQVLFNNNDTINAAAQLYYATSYAGVIGMGLGASVPGDTLIHWPGRVLHVKYTSGRASVLVESSTQAEVNFVANGAPLNGKLVVFRNHNGRFFIAPHTDDGNSWIRPIVIDNVTGKMAILHASTEPVPTSAIDVEGDIEVGLTNFYYFGDPSTDGSFRFAQASGALYVQKRESGVWVNKATASEPGGGSNATQLQGRDVSNAAPTSGNGLVWNGSVWAPAVVPVASHTHPASEITTPTDAGSLQSRAIATTAPTEGQVLKWDSTDSNWKPASLYVGPGVMPGRCVIHATLGTPTLYPATHELTWLSSVTTVAYRNGDETFDGTSTITVPADGLYQVSFSLGTLGYGFSGTYTEVMVGSTSVMKFRETPARGTVNLRLSATNTVRLRWYSQYGQPSWDSEETFFSVQKISD